MPTWLLDILDGVGIDVATAIWNLTMKAVAGLLTRSPQNFSPETWAFVSGTLYPWAQAIGLSALNLFFLIAVLRALENIHQNITLEMVLEAFFKIIIANVLFLNMHTLMLKFFDIATLMTGSVFSMQAPELKVEDITLSTALFYWLLGSLFILVSIVCSVIILMTVYGRYIKLYVLVVLAPFAMPALIGGQGVSQTFYAWVKTFLLNCFEIVVIAMTLVISWKLMGSGVTIFTSATLESIFGGGADVLNSLMTMILVTASVKGASAFLSKAMGL